MTHHPGRIWAYVGAALGAVLSISANVAHSFLQNADPPPLAIGLSISWPIALFVLVEILTRIVWPSGTGWWLLKFCGVTPVAAVTAVVSYGHLSGLLEHYGESDWTVAVGPIAVDGLMLMSTSALLATSHRVASAVPVAAVEAVASRVAAPVAQAVTRRPAPTWVTVPVGATRISVRQVFATGDVTGDVTDVPPAKDDEIVITPVPRPAAETRELARRLTERHARVSPGEKLSQEQLAKMLGMSRWALRGALAQDDTPVPVAA